MLSQTYENLRIKIQTELSEALFLSFTNDIWTYSKTKTSYLSLTAHCKDIEGSHTSFNINESIKEMLENLGIPMDRIHVLLCDNAFKMKAGIYILESSSEPCFIQLIIKDSLLSGNNISVLIAKAR